MKRTLLIFAFMFCMAGYAQNTGIKLTKSATFEDRYNKSQIIYVKPDSEGGFYMVRRFEAGVLSAAAGYYFEHYNKDMALIKDSEYAPEYRTYEKYKTPVGVVSGGDYFHIIDINYNLKEKAYICNVHSANIATHEFTDKELFRLDRKEADKYGTLSLSSLFYDARAIIDDSSAVAFITSDNGEAFAIALNIRSKDNKTLKLYSFDNQLNKKLEHTYVRDVKNRHFVFKNIDIDTTGTSLYLLGAAHLEENSRKNFTYELTHITTAGEQTAAFENDKPAAETLKTLLVKNRLICAGFYTDDKNGWYSGISYFEIDPATLKPITIKHTTFSAQIIDDKAPHWWQQRNVNPLVFRNIIVTPNNDLILNAEEYFVSTNNNQEYYNYNDIISARISQAGETLWVTDIKKSQGTFTDTSFLSYTPAFKNNTAYYFINASENVKKNSDGTIEFRQAGRNRSDFTVVAIDRNGTMSYEKLLDDDNSEVPFMTARGVATPGAVYFMGRRVSKKQLLKADLK